MPKKQVLINDPARAAFMKGRFIVQGTVIPTIGPRGRNAAIGKEYGPPRITNDGVTIAKEVDLTDPAMNAGAQGLKDDAERMNREAGDGSSGFMTLTRALDREGYKYLSRGVDVMALRSGMEDAAQQVVVSLRAMTQQVDNEGLARVATISAQSDTLGRLIADTVSKVGRDGVITVEEAMTVGVTAEIVEGMEIPQGFVSPAMATNLEKMIAEYVDVPVLVTSDKITMNEQIVPFLNKLSEASKTSLVIFCGDMDGDALKTLLFNKLRGGFSVLAVKVPGYGNDKNEVLQDIAVAVGATLVSSDTGTPLASVELDVLGAAHRIKATETSTVIADGAGSKEAIEARLTRLRDQLKDVDNTNLSKTKLEERIGKLAGGVAIIKVGAVTEGDATYLKDKIEDAVNATKAALAEGVVPGGGSALLLVADILERVRAPWWTLWPWQWKRRTAREIGYDIVIEAIKEPFNQIISNAGKDPRPIRIQVMRHWGIGGYNTVTEQFEPNMFEAGIVDPLKVIRIAVEHAVSSSANALTTEVLIVDDVPHNVK